MTQKKPISLKNETKQEKHQKTAAKAWSTAAYLGDKSYRELIYRTNRAPADPNQEPAGSSCSSSSAKQAIRWCHPPRKPALVSSSGNPGAKVNNTLNGNRKHGPEAVSQASCYLGTSVRKLKRNLNSNTAA